MLRKKINNLEKIIELDTEKEFQQSLTHRLFKKYKVLNSEKYFNAKENNLINKIKGQANMFKIFIFFGWVICSSILFTGSVLYKNNNEYNVKIEQFNQHYNVNYNDWLEDTYDKLTLDKFLSLKNKDTPLSEDIKKALNISERQRADHLEIDNYSLFNLTSICLLMMLFALWGVILIKCYERKKEINSYKEDLKKFKVRPFIEISDIETDYKILINEISEKYEIDKNEKIKFYDFMLREVEHIKEIENNVNAKELMRKYLDNLESLKVNLYSEKDKYNFYINLDKIEEDLNKFENYKNNIVKLVKS